MSIINKFNGSFGLAIVVLTMMSLNAGAAVPDFAAMKDVKQKKRAFFAYMYPLIEQANKEILIKRSKIRQIRLKMAAGNKLTTEELAFIRKVSDEYEIKSKDVISKKNVETLYKIVDYVPPSLALAQSANESAWGTSRFAKQANNFFGQWCFKKGCGIVPAQRSAGSKHEVRKFASTLDSVRSYLKNINISRAYSSLRNMRFNLRQKKSMLAGYSLAEGLIKYSSRGKAYVKEIRSMIRSNKLKKFDEQFWDGTVVKS